MGAVDQGHGHSLMTDKVPQEAGSEPDRAGSHHSLALGPLKMWNTALPEPAQLCCVPTQRGLRSSNCWNLFRMLVFCPDS